MTRLVLALLLVLLAVQPAASVLMKESIGADQIVPDSVDGEWSAFFALPRTSHTVVYDPTDDTAIIAAGSGRNNAFLTDIWKVRLGEPSKWTEIASFDNGLDGRWGHAAVFDPLRHRMILFGGRSLRCACNETWILTLDEPITLTRLDLPGPLPRGGWGQSAIYDPVNDRVIVFGGTDGPNRYWNEVWVLWLSGDVRWEQLLPSGTPPSPRAEQSAIYDPTRQRMVILGGDYAPLNDVWALSLDSLPSWTKITPVNVNSTDYWEHAAIYDPVRDRMIVVSGGSNSNTTWALSLGDSATWSVVPAQNTTGVGRAQVAAIYDPIRDRLVIHGGGAYGSFYRDMRALPLGGNLTWSTLSPQSAWPLTRDLHAGALDPIRNRVIVFGGEGQTDLNDTWALNLTEPPIWSALQPVGTAPSARHGHSMVYDPVGDRMIVFGGANGSGRLNDTWALNMSGAGSWSQISVTGAPAARMQHGAIFDPVRQVMMIFGGYDGTNHRSDLWTLALNPPQWTEVSAVGSLPTGRSQHSMVYDPVGDRVLLFAGWGGGAIWLNDTWELRLAPVPTWNQLLPAGDLPVVRRGHSLVLDALRGRLVMFGGSGGGSSRFSDVWSLVLDGDGHWFQLSPNNLGPSPRKWHSATYSPVADEMIVFGGDPGNDETWYLKWPAATAVEAGTGIDPLMVISQPEPNPSRNTTRLRFRSQSPGSFQCDFFDVSGRRVRTIQGFATDSGEQEITWNGSDDSGSYVAAGTYFARIECAGHVAGRTITRF